MSKSCSRLASAARAMVFALLCGCVGWAGEGFLAQGMYEVGFAGTYTHVDVSGEDAHFLLGMGDLSYFVTDRVSLGGTLLGAYVFDTEDVEDDSSLLGLELNARYHFPAVGCAIPYVGLQVGYLRARLAGESGDGAEYGIHGGLKFPITANVFFDTQVRYSRAESSDIDMEADLVMLLFGFRFYFGEGADMAPAAAASPQPFAAGDVELNALGGYAFASMKDTAASPGDPEDVEAHVLFAAAQIGYWLTDSVSVGIGPVAAYIPQAGDVNGDDTFIGFAELGANYNFACGRLVPYVGLHGGYGIADIGGADSQALWEYGVHGGCKYLLTNTVFLDTQIRYTEFDLDQTTIEADLNATQVLVGLGFRL